jgi:DNA polymerase-3 subunit gamma/tau
LFGDVAGQDAAVSLLRSSFLERRLAQAYLFSGPRGCGKTTAARLLARAVNCKNPTADGEPCGECDSCKAIAAGEHMDVMEIDGASNRGIESIRELKSHVGLASFMGGTKVYILDEVHMLTVEAFNALLKTLEEPPPSVMFIFATTEPHKVPVTIRSRCQHIPFHRISTETIAGRLRFISGAEGIEADDSALWEIARSADGALRDAISLFEQAVALGHGALTPDAVKNLFGGGSRAEMERWVSALRENPDEAAALLKSALDLGVSPERFLDGLFPLFRDMWVFSLWGEKSFAGTSLSEEEKKFLRAEVPGWDTETLKRAAMSAAALYPRARFGLKSDVFAGLLLFEMMSLSDGRDAAPASPAAPAAPAAPSVPRGEPKPAPRRETGETLSEIFARVMKEDMTIAAALINVTVFRDGGALGFDFSEAPPAAEIALSLPKAKNALARVFGMTAAAPAEPENAAAPPAQTAARVLAPSSAEAISRRLGADILMSKPLVSEDTDTDTGGIEDEQF